jgi:NAD(P)-dependent dehydrogenase (short-subunit alcohol dehydrogenase family)
VEGMFFSPSTHLLQNTVLVLQNFEHNEYLKAKVQEAVAHKDEKIVDALARKYLEDVKAGREKEENWAKNLLQYRESKLFMSIYARVLAAQLESRPEGHRVYVNAVCPGAMKTDLLSSFKEKMGVAKAEELAATVRWRPVEESATAAVSLALLPASECPHGKFLVKDLEERAW